MCILFIAFSKVFGLTNLGRIVSSNFDGFTLGSQAPGQDVSECEPKCEPIRIRDHYWLQVNPSWRLFFGLIAPPCSVSLIPKKFIIRLQGDSFGCGQSFVDIEMVIAFLFKKCML